MYGACDDNAFPVSSDRRNGTPREFAAGVAVVADI
jgi:hypothetical protein